MSNALEQAKRAADNVANVTTVRIDLKLLQALIAEIDRLQPRVIKDYTTVKDLTTVGEPNISVVMKHKDIRA